MEFFALVFMVFAVGFLFISVYAFCKLEQTAYELRYLKHDYAKAIDGKLAAEREVERMKEKMAKIKQELEE